MRKEKPDSQTHTHTTQRSVGLYLMSFMQLSPTALSSERKMDALEERREEESKGGREGGRRGEKVWMRRVDGEERGGVLISYHHIFVFAALYVGFF